MNSRTTVLRHDRAAETDGAITRLRQQFLADFDPEYVDNVLLPYFTVSIYNGERLSLPMIGLELTKENAIPAHLWGLLSDDWKPQPEAGSTVFLQGLENRGPGNLRKKIYMSAVTPDLYEPMYGGKIRAFFDTLLDDANADKPLMRRYLDGYLDLYWDLHLGVSPDAIPDKVRELGHAFMAVLGWRDPTLKIYYDNYMTVRANRSLLNRWIDERVGDLLGGRTPNPKKTFVHYWITNGDQGDHFKHQDVIFECFHNFLAFSQWGNTIYNVMSRLTRNGDPDVRAWFQKTMQMTSHQVRDRSAFSPLERFVMELFRTISPNAGSISALEENRTPPYERHGYIVSPHAATSFDPRHWQQPTRFDPNRYMHVPTSYQIDEMKCEQIGFAQCPFEPTPFEVKDGRKAELRSSGFGTVYGVVDGEPLPVCDYAGFAPFGFGYRRCPGEQLTISVFADFLKGVWERGIEFDVLDIAEPEQLPVGPSTVIADNIGFHRR